MICLPCAAAPINLGQGLRIAPCGTGDSFPFGGVALFLRTKSPGELFQEHRMPLASCSGVAALAGRWASFALHRAMSRRGNTASECGDLGHMSAAHSLSQNGGQTVDVTTVASLNAPMSAMSALSLRPFSPMLILVRKVQNAPLMPTSRPLARGGVLRSVFSGRCFRSCPSGGGARSVSPLMIRSACSSLDFTMR